MRPHPRDVAAGRVRLLLVACLVVFAALTAVVWLLPSWLDERAIVALGELRTREGVAAARVATRLGDRIVTIALTTSAVVVLLFLRKRAAVFLTIAVAGAAGLNLLAKWAVGRPRPSIIEPVYSAAGLSFPSGHSMASFAFFVGLWLVARAEGFRHERAVRTLAIVVVPVVGFTRAYLGVHYPTDVIAGWALAGAWLAVVHAWYVRHPPGADAPADEPAAPDESSDQPPT